MITPEDHPARPAGERGVGQCQGVEEKGDRVGGSPGKGKGRNLKSSCSRQRDWPGTGKGRSGTVTLEREKEQVRAEGERDPVGAGVG